MYHASVKRASVFHWAVVSFFCAWLSAIRAQAPERPGWTLVWSDEFNYTGHPDPAKWGYAPDVPGPPQPRRPDGREVEGPRRGPGDGESSQGEIDLMESWGSHPNEIAVHIHGTRGHTPSATVHVDHLYNRFHLYALEWYPDHMDFFLDERKILSYAKDPGLGWSFDHPMYLILNIACGGPDEPAPDDSRLPQFMTVDFVRVYRKTP